ncbi:ankyrin repeat-containing domain protein [Orientia tsutsugamushi str. UT76]|nr:ankyrin repeat-containing domain protein [Orientia tsutsugamushi str. UT76]
MNTVALSLAIKHGDVNAVKRILDVDPTIVNSQDRYGRTLCIYQFSITRKNY